MIKAQFPKQLGRYDIQDSIGKGGMGTVYKALDSFLKRIVALKVVNIASMDIAAPDKRRLDRCLHEARLAAQLVHPNIVITYDAGIVDDQFFIALEYIDGRSLHKYTREQNLLPRNRVLEIIYTICYALDYIHKLGMIHLDVKPSNIMLTRRDEVKLMDFGISRILKMGKVVGDNVGALGTPAYMSPEQIGADPTVDQRSDVFSLGVVLYELLSGKKPFEGENIYETMYRVNSVEPEPISRIQPDNRREQLYRHGD